MPLKSRLPVLRELLAQCHPKTRMTLPGEIPLERACACILKTNSISIGSPNCRHLISEDFNFYKKSTYAHLSLGSGALPTLHANPDEQKPRTGHF